MASVCLCLLLAADLVGEQFEEAVGRHEGDDPLCLPALEADARVEADIVHQPRVDEGEGEV